MNRRSLLVSLYPLLTLPRLAGAETPALDQQSDNMVLRSAAIFVVVVMIWVVLYKAVYPFFLRYYRDEFCKTIFWNLFLLYTLTWVFVAFYVVLDVGFYWAWLP